MKEEHMDAKKHKFPFKKGKKGKKGKHKMPHNSHDKMSKDDAMAKLKKIQG
jgi:hypothetical protein